MGLLEVQLRLRSVLVVLASNDNAAWRGGVCSFMALVAGAGFEPATFRLCACRATGLLHPASTMVAGSGNGGFSLRKAGWPLRHIGAIAKATDVAAGA